VTPVVPPEVLPLVPPDVWSIDPEVDPEVSAVAVTGLAVPATVSTPDVTAAATAIRLLSLITDPLTGRPLDSCRGTGSSAPNGRAVRRGRARHPRQRGEG
jgi:hypothetical protein